MPEGNQSCMTFIGAVGLAGTPPPYMVPWLSQNQSQSKIKRQKNTSPKMQQNCQLSKLPKFDLSSINPTFICQFSASRKLKNPSNHPIIKTPLIDGRRGGLDPTVLQWWY